MRRWRFAALIFLLFFPPPAAASPVRAVYLGANAIDSVKRVSNILNLLDTTEINAVVVDFKDDGGLLLRKEAHLRTLEALKKKNVYLICRVVTLKDDAFARVNPEFAVHRRDSPEKLWRDHKGSHWLDPSYEEVIGHIAAVAEEAVGAGCDEVNFDYIRFPSPLDGDMKNARYPSGEYPNSRKREVMRGLLAKISETLRTRHPDVAFSADMFGYAFLDGAEAGIGQHLDDFAEFGFILAPMAYPSHYDCNAFGVPDPNKIPYIVYRETLKGGLRFLREKGYPSPRVRPWLQGFTWPNIFGCGVGENGKGRRGKVGTVTEYAQNRARFREQIRALESLGIKEWIVWHSGAKYSEELFNKKEGQ